MALRQPGGDQCRACRGEITIEAALVLAYGGVEHVTTTFVTTKQTAQMQVAQLGEDTAHTGYQMRRALDRRAEAIRAMLNSDA
jgi:hypothetical protein